MPGAIENPDAWIGECAIINSGSIIEHDCHISDFAHVSPGAVLGGSVFVGEGSHIGIGSIIRQGIRIGTNAMIGAGAVVVKDVDDGATVMGVVWVPMVNAYLLAIKIFDVGSNEVFEDLVVIDTDDAEFWHYCLWLTLGAYQAADLPNSLRRHRPRRIRKRR
jgi:tetrahydrodipicolinate N-succinyltransferase